MRQRTYGGVRGRFCKGSLYSIKYTELFLKLGSDYRVIVEEFKISEFKSSPEILKIFN